jgi:hypothetical protein
MQKDLVVVLIISHKPVLNKYELISLIQCYKILGRYPIKIICPKGLNVTFYENNLPNPEFDFIDSVWQSSYANFNRLKVDQFLYSKYSGYQYILFYEPDAFVFRDELEYWCNAGFDYIGGPWFEGWHSATSSSNIIGVGNGGFSLRKTSSILNQIKILKQLHVISIYDNFNWKGIIVRLPKLLLDFIRYKSFTPEYIMTTGQEDYFWSEDMQNKYNEYLNNKSFVAKVFKILPVKKLKIADVTTAIKFSMECQPTRLFEMNKKNLPFGCHAWYKYDYEFWKPFILEAGYKLPTIIDNHQLR